mmetsp:Transcript_12636/g.17419  ORF Transcript_12636/g.17419 Transcript_12636/m.17419 type:complete len:107 (-) Transcript_12636:195-515(-)
MVLLIFIFLLVFRLWVEESVFSLLFLIALLILPFSFLTNIFGTNIKHKREAHPIKIKAEVTKKEACESSAAITKTGIPTNETIMMKLIARAIHSLSANSMEIFRAT